MRYLRASVRALTVAGLVGLPAAFAAETTVAGGRAPVSSKVQPLGAQGHFINRLDATFGTDAEATVHDKDQLAKIAYFRYIYGDASTTGPGTDGLYDNYRARHRDYPSGDPRSLHVFTADALVLKAHCGLQTANRSDCSDGNIESGMVRFALPIRPGSYVEMQCRMPVAAYAWPAFWLNPGEEDPPAVRGGKPVISGLGWPPEIDIFDQFGFNNTKPGHYLLSLTPTGHNDAAFGHPHDLYHAPDYGDGWYYKPSQDLTQGFHTYGLDWGRDNVLKFSLDGRVYKSVYYEWNSKDGAPAHLIASLQVGAKFNDLSGMTDQGGVPNGWDWPIRYVRVWDEQGK